jgi:hypothetical protein
VLPENFTRQSLMSSNADYRPNSRITNVGDFRKEQILPACQELFEIHRCLPNVVYATEAA